MPAEISADITGMPAGIITDISWISECSLRSHLSFQESQNDSWDPSCYSHNDSWDLCCHCGNDSWDVNKADKRISRAVPIPSLPRLRLWVCQRQTVVSATQRLHGEGPACFTCSWKNTCSFGAIWGVFRQDFVHIHIYTNIHIYINVKLDVRFYFIYFM